MLRIRSLQKKDWQFTELEQLESRMEKEILHMWRTAEVYNLRPADIVLIQELKQKEENSEHTAVA